MKQERGVVNKHPRVLVVSGYTFNERSGGAITMSNLFRDWPKERLAILDFDPGVHDSTVCVNRFQASRESAVDGVSPIEDIGSLRGAKARILSKLCLTPGVKPIHLDKAAIAFVSGYKPDVIYSQASQLSYMRLTRSLLNTTGAGFVYHIMDDFQHSTYRSGILSPLVRRVFLSEFQGLIQRAGVRMGISASMCAAYKAQFGKEFYCFHNPIDLDVWSRGSINVERSDVNIKNVVYVGRIGVGCEESLLGFARAVKLLDGSGTPVSMSIFTNLPLVSRIERPLKDLGVRLLAAPSRVEDVAGVLKSADVLAYPIDFDQASISFLRHSMPTKLPTYMASGTHIVVFGPEECHPVQFAKTGGWASVVTENNIQLLANTLREGLADPIDGVRLGNLAKAAAASSFDARLIRNQFASAIGLAMRK